VEPRAPGTAVDGYAIEALLHAGGNGYVYAVRAVTAPDPGFPLVMKVPGVGPGQPPLGLVAFETEQALLRRLTGPFVPRFVAAGDVADVPYVVMERIDGTGLAELVRRAPLPFDEIAGVGAALADALQSVHAQDVVHLDVKPENFMLRSTGGAVLLDFGFARHAHYPDLLAEERHCAAGSAPYVSPEQLAGIRSEPRSDLFALGAVLYELTTGEPPFGDPRTWGGMRDRLWREPVAPRARRADCPPWLQEILLHLLEVDAARRYATAAHVAFDLRHPEQVALGPRAERLRGPRFGTQLARWWHASRDGPALRTPRAVAPVIMVGVDTTHPDDARLPVIRAATQRLIAGSDDYRLMCVSVIEAAPLGEGESRAETASGRHLDHSVRLRHWAQPLGLPPSRQSLHVIEAADSAQALLDLARANHVDVVVLGAPNPAERKLAWWRSTASRVAARAHCSVHLARVPRHD